MFYSIHLRIHLKIACHVEFYADVFHAIRRVRFSDRKVKAGSGWEARTIAAYVCGRLPYALPPACSKSINV